MTAPADTSARRPALLAAGLSGCVVLLAFVCLGVTTGVAGVVLLRSSAPAAPTPSPGVADALDPASDVVVTSIHVEEADDDTGLEDTGGEDTGVPDDAPAVVTAPRRRRPAPSPEPEPEPEPEPTWDLVEPTPPPPPPKPAGPAPGMGAVQLEIASGDALHVYASGDLIASMSPNRRKTLVDLPPGRHRVLFKDVVNGRTVHKGVLVIEEDRVVRLGFGQHQEPVQLYGPDGAWRGR